MVGNLHPPGDVVVGDAERKPKEQLQDLGHRELPASGRRVREDAEPLSAPLAASAPVVKFLELPRPSALGTPGSPPPPEADFTKSTFGGCEKQITRKHTFHRTRESEPLVRRTLNCPT